MDIKAILGRVFDWAQPTTQDSNAATQPPAGGIAEVPDSIETPKLYNTYFTGNFLSADDFNQEQDYGQSKGGDYSDNVFDPRQHFTGVQMQQGRVQLDNDTNEQATVEERDGRTSVQFGDGLVGRRLLSDDLLRAFQEGDGAAGNVSGSSDDDDPDGKP
jgi:hypothetical protein